MLVLFVAVVDYMPLYRLALLPVNTRMLRHIAKFLLQLSLQCYPILGSHALVGKVWVLYVMLE